MSFKQNDHVRVMCSDGRSYYADVEQDMGNDYYKLYISDAAWTGDKVYYSGSAFMQPCQGGPVPARPAPVKAAPQPAPNPAGSGVSRCYICHKPAVECDECGKNLEDLTAYELTDGRTVCSECITFALDDAGEQEQHEDGSGTVCCCLCGAELEPEDVVYNDAGEPYCEDCYGDAYVHCYVCGKELPEEDACEDSHGNVYCTECHAGHCADCDNCGDSWPKDELISHDGLQLCPDCIEQYEDDEDDTGDDEEEENDAGDVQEEDGGRYLHNGEPVSDEEFRRSAADLPTDEEVRAREKEDPHDDCEEMPAIIDVEHLGWRAVFQGAPVRVLKLQGVKAYTCTLFGRAITRWLPLYELEAFNG